MNSVTRLLNETFEGASAKPRTVTREMSITSTQFLARLSRVREGILDSAAGHQGRCNLRNANGTVGITWRKKAKRHIGALALPVIEVRLDFKTYRDSDSYSRSTSLS